MTACGNNAAEAYQEAQTARTLLAQGDLPGARQAIARAMALRDDQLDILLLDAQIKARMGDMRSAYDAYRLVLAMDPRHPEALLGVAQLGLGLGETRQSREALDELLLLMPGQPEALLLKGVHALNDKDYGEALTLAEDILKLDPADRRGIVLKARALSQTGRRDEAIKILRDATETIGNDEMIATALLENAREASNVDVMLEQFSMLGRARPGSIDLAIDEANVRYKSGDVNGARTVGADVIRRFGNDPKAMQRLKNLWREYDPDPLGREERRQLATDGALNARIAAARHYLAQGDTDAAAELTANGNDPRVVGLRARIGVATKAPGSINLIAGILSQDKSNCDALAAAAEWNLAQGNPRAAVDPAQKAATDCRDSSDGYLLLARAYDKQGRLAGAERVFREGLAAHPDDYALTAAYSQWLLREKRADGAQAIAERLTDRAPQRPSSWRLLATACAATKENRCLANARDGEAAARTDFSIDLPPGERSTNPLLGQQWS